MQLLRTARDVLARQWEDALAAMRKVHSHHSFTLIHIISFGDDWWIVCGMNSVMRPLWYSINNAMPLCMFHRAFIHFMQSPIPDDDDVNNNREENKALKMSERRLLLDNAELKRQNGTPSLASSSNHWCTMRLLRHIELVGQRQDAHETRMRDMGLGMKEAENQHRMTLDEAESLRSQLSTVTVCTITHTATDH